MSTVPVVPIVLTIGGFDGVHLGHAALLRRARAIADAGAQPGRVIALAFHPHPATVLDSKRAPSPLTDWPERERLLRAAGADAVVRLDPASGVLDRTADDFISALVREHRPAAIVEGADFRFGRARAGDLSTLRALGESLGFAVEQVPTVDAALLGGEQAPVSSTLVRWLVARGRIADAERLLGRPYSLDAVVVRGARRGRLLGMPTANMDCRTLAPADGVYAALATLPGGARMPAAVSVGTNPTFDGPSRSVEAHVIGWSGPAPAPAAHAVGAPDDGGFPGEYGWRIRIEFRAWLRDQIRFPDAESLVVQMRDDLRRALEFVPPEVPPEAPPPRRVERALA